jgi:hypothetical protein
MPMCIQNNGVKKGWWGWVGVWIPEKRRPYPYLIYNLTFELYLERQDECNALASVVSYVL